MTIERNTLSLANDLIDSWRFGDLRRIAIELTSCVLETEQIPDPYYYPLIDGKLRDSITNRPVEDFCETETYLGKVEMDALLDIQDWANRESEGLSVWVSPPYKGVYSVSKIILSEILEKDGYKMLLNRAIKTNWDESEVLRIFKTQSIENLRRYPIFIKPSDYQNLMLFLSENIGAQVVDQIASGYDFEKRDEILKKMEPLARELSRGSRGSNFSNYVEKLDISCPTRSAFKVFSGEVRILCCVCPFCGNEVAAQIYGGMIHCPKCKKEKVWREEN
ncbi:MAG: hypothetical protein HY044_01000 [Candidatus Woesebacteria bacterium]|nr:MAG: hypothetical protein HY044_01000 [Candidatus Woesebacteria bacterium]